MHVGGDTGGQEMSRTTSNLQLRAPLAALVIVLIMIAGLLSSGSLSEPDVVSRSTSRQESND
jgi:hypothetical protein